MSKDVEREKEIAEGTARGNSTYEPPSQLVSEFERGRPDWALEVINALGELTVVVPRERIAEVCAHLKTAPGLEFNMLADLCGVDRGPEEEPRFEVNYHLFSTTKFHRLRLKVLLNDEDTHVPTVTGVWRTANWHERETFDMFGVIFDGHPDLRRILLPDDWQGHALRKDFPLRGYEPYSLT
ncbi:MAG TPA: NADH-quinone oxidoreductase subunit C [Pyrinomonadaceae bacterium]|nr:NADH-quinone oxidoreductase subunit C [Pyrinomonadaceae bacterium]